MKKGFGKNLYVYTDSLKHMESILGINSIIQLRLIKKYKNQTFRKTLDSSFAI